jgi:hypothetical protein
MKRDKNKNTLSDKRRRKSSKSYLEGGGESNYARKKKYLLRTGMWGFEFHDPKPWKRAK